jgi:hypothetical protein
MEGIQVLGCDTLLLLQVVTLLGVLVAVTAVPVPIEERYGHLTVEPISLSHAPALEISHTPVAIAHAPVIKEVEHHVSIECTRTRDIETVRENAVRYSQCSLNLLAAVQILHSILSFLIVLFYLVVSRGFYL